MTMANSTKIALVTGGNKGIGYETCLQLAKQGITVLLGARDQERGKEAVEKLKKSGVNARFVHVDLESPRTFEAAAGLIEREYGKLDILVNNAGVFVEPHDSPPSRKTQQDLRKTFDVNFFAV